MARHNANNERVKRDYFTFLRESRGHSEASVDQAAKALARFEEHTKCRDFKKFHHELAIAYKRHLSAQLNATTGTRLSKSTVRSELRCLTRFFDWLAMQSGYRSRFTCSDATYFNLSANDARVATATRERPAPSLEQVLHVLERMPADTEIEQRNRALFAFTLLTGARDSALASFKMKHVDIHRGTVHQDAREVRTKNAKTFMTVFFPVGDHARRIVEEWVTYLQKQKLWGPDDPLFPSTEVVQDEDRQFKPVGLKRQHWSNATPIRSIFRDAFERCGLPYFNPHSFRKTLVQLGERLCRNAEQFKAWSQNLGHERVLTTFNSYGTVSPHRQAELIQALGAEEPNDKDVIAKIQDLLKSRPCQSRA